MKVIFNPTDMQKGSGPTSSMSYQSPAFVEAMEAAFHVKANERIVQIEITPEGVVARFEYITKSRPKTSN